MSTMSPLERRIHSNRQRARRRAIAEGRPTTTKVDATPAREHAERLRAIGISTARLAELSEVPLATVRYIVFGSGGHPPARVTEQDHLDRILAVPAVPLLGAPGAFIDACGTVRRLQALIASGWSVAELARRLGVFPPNLAQMLQRPQVRVTTALAVRRLYDEVWDVAPPQDTPRQRRAVREARERAARAGWPTPAGWDDDDIDLPEPDLKAKHAAQVAAMDDTQLGAYNRAAYREGERSPLIRAAAAEYSRRCDVCRVAFAAADHPGSQAHPKRETSLQTGIPYYLGTKERPAFLPVWIVGYACRRICRCWECNSRRMPSPMPMEVADRVMAEVHRPKLGRRTLQPFRMGQDECLHLAAPECGQCRAGYHTSCTGTSWASLHETWIRDSDGSDLFWTDGSHYLVWTPPRECQCTCRTASAPPTQISAAKTPPRSTTATPRNRRITTTVQLPLFDLETP